MDDKQMIDELLAIPDVRDAEVWLRRKLAEAKREGMEAAAQVIDGKGWTDSWSRAAEQIRLRIKERYL